MMPNKTIYVADADLPLFEQAQASAGGNLSAAIAQALRVFLAEAETTSGEIILTVTEQGIKSRKRFRGHLIAEQKTLTPDKARSVVYRVYHTEKDHFVVWSKTSPNWGGYNWQSEWQNWGKHAPWQEDWWQGATRLDLYQTLNDLQPNLPASLYARVRQVVASGSEIEDLDI
jgi:EXLDI family protein